MKKGQKLNKEKLYKNRKFPEQVLEVVDALPYTQGKSGQRFKALHFLSKLMDKSMRNMGVQCSYVPMTADYIRFDLGFGTRYRKVLQPLLDAGVIECDETFCNVEGFTKPFYYRVNPEYFKGKVEFRMIRIPYKAKVEKDLELEQRVVLREFREFMESITINEKKLTQSMLEKLDSVDEEVYKYNYSVDAKQNETIQYTNGHEVKYVKVWQLVEKSFKSDKVLIQDGMDYYLGTEDEYKQMKKNYIECYFESAIKDLVEGHYRAIRDKKGNRLHTNLTNFPTELREVLIENNDMVNLDSNNSQFTIQSKLMRDAGIDAPDVLKFNEASAKGVLYELVRDELSLSKGKKGRKEAKSAMFLINFSNNSFQSKLKTKFAAVFPTVAKFVSDYKEFHGSKEFPLQLQRIEANLFIDQIKPQLKKLGIVHTTIHDSVVCRKEDAVLVKEVMEEVFRKNNVYANIDLDEPKAETGRNLAA